MLPLGELACFVQCNLGDLSVDKRVFICLHLVCYFPCDCLIYSCTVANCSHFCNVLLWLFQNRTIWRLAYFWDYLLTTQKYYYSTLFDSFKNRTISSINYFFEIIVWTLRNYILTVISSSWNITYISSKSLINFDIQPQDQISAKFLSPPHPYYFKTL